MGVLGAEVQERGDIVPVADSLHCTVEINTTLQSNYTPIKKKKGYSCIFIISSLFSTVVQLWTLSKKLMVLSNVIQTTGRSVTDRITHAPKREGAERPRK